MAALAATADISAATLRSGRYFLSWTGLTLLAHSAVPFSFWDMAFDTSTFLMNRMPTPVLNNVSPYKIFFAKSPDYSILRSFGCACFPYLRPYNSRKLAFRTILCVFLGNGRNHIGYKCYDPASRKIYINRHVVFYETRFPSAQNGNLETRDSNHDV